MFLNIIENGLLTLRTLLHIRPNPYLDQRQCHTATDNSLRLLERRGTAPAATRIYSRNQKECNNKPV